MQGASLLVDPTLDNYRQLINFHPWAMSPSSPSLSSICTSSSSETWGGNILAVVRVKSWVKELIWLLIGYTRVNNQSGAGCAAHWLNSWPWIQHSSFHPGFSTATSSLGVGSPPPLRLLRRWDILEKKSEIQLQVVKQKVNTRCRIR